MFFLCCRVRERKPRGDRDLVLEDDETTQLIGPDQPTIYTTDVIVDTAARIEADALRDIVRETENKMVNITDPQPFLFRDPFSPMHDMIEDRGPEYVPSLTETSTTPCAPSAPPPTRAPSPTHSPPRTRRRSHGYYNHEGRSTSSSRSISSSSSRELSDEEDDSYRPALPRDPILKVRLIPVPRSARREGPNASDSRDAAKLTGGVENGIVRSRGTPVVHTLSKEDQDSIMTISDSLRVALQHDFRITESLKVIRTWD